MRQNDLRRIYGGQNLLPILPPDLRPLLSFTWGDDLSGTMTQAGGVGGLLMASLSGTSCFAAYDGNGHVTALINANDLSTAARYEYSPYGELIRETGMFARANPFRFSTKFWDEESGLVCYNFRYYNPACGRWVNRDPSEERGGCNLYGFVINNPIKNIDEAGLSLFEIDFGGGCALSGDSMDELEGDLSILDTYGTGLKTDSITIKGHGDPTLVSMSQDTLITVNAVNQIQDQNGRNITDLLNNILAPGGFVDLAGCETGRGPDNLAQRMSVALPNITVCGGAGLCQLGIPWSKTTIGKKNYYINGQLVYSAW